MSELINKTEALVLRVVPFSKTSHIVTWLTPEYGKLTTVIRGACRPRSPFLGQYDLFYTCELLVYTRERNNLHIARECAPINTRKAFRTDWKACACASYMCDLLARVSTRGGNQRELYQMASSALDFLCMNGARLQFLFWFELRLVTALGFGPQLMKCPSCGHDLSPLLRGDRRAREKGGVMESLRFSFSRGGMLCRRCAEPHGPETGSREAGSYGTDRIGDRSIRISPAILAMLRSWQQAQSPRVAQNTKCTADQCGVLRRLLGRFLSYHLDMRLVSRKTAMDLVANPITKFMA